MKIRVQGNSIRLRLTQPEVLEFDQNKILTEKIGFPGGSHLECEIRQTPETNVMATFNRSLITIQIPEGEALDWINTTRVGIKETLPLESGKLLRILVEKDYQCLHKRPGEDESGAFPNPEAE